MIKELDTYILPRRLKFASILNSLSFFLLSFIIVYFFNLLTTYLIANTFGIESVIRNFRVEFLVSPHSEKWNIDNIVLIFVSAPLVSLFIGGIASRLLNIFRGDNENLKLFLIWTFLHSMTFSFGAFVASVLSQDGIWYALAWMRIPFYFQVLLAVTFIFILYFAGSFVTIYFYEVSVYPNQSDIMSRKLWFLNSALITWFAGSIIIILFLIPDIIIYEILILCSTLLLILPMIVRLKLIPESITENLVNTKIYWKFLLLAVLLFVLLRFIT